MGKLDVEKFDIKLGWSKKVTKGIYRARHLYADDNFTGDLATRQSKALVRTFKKMKDVVTKSDLAEMMNGFVNDEDNGWLK